MKECPNCGSGLSRSIQPRMVKQPDGTSMKMMREYPEGFLTCTNPCCRRVIDTNTGIIYKNGTREN